MILYRSYYYDTETGLYYLNSRYYDPELGRFINTDDISYLAPDIINGLNLYSYCNNNPVIFTDNNGCFLDSYSEILDFISTIFETGINLGIAGISWAIKSGARPNNIGLGIFLKDQTKRLTSLSKTSNILSKVTTSIAILSIGISVVEDMFEDINRKYNAGRIISNVVTSTIIYGSTAFAAGTIGSKIGALFGSAIPGLGTAIGVAVCFVIGTTFNWLFNLQINGKSIIDHIKDGLYDFWRWLFG